MTVPISRSSEQHDEALRLLADLYARRFGSFAARPDEQVLWHANARLSDLLREAPSQQDASRQLTELLHLENNPYVHTEAEARLWTSTIENACDWLAQVIQAGGDARCLLAGETDGFRHLCRYCCQEEQHFQQVRFFDHRMRRPLLKAEVSNRRSIAGKCQICQQVLVPTRWVVLVPVGTVKHAINCSCGHCNHASRAFVANLYEQDFTTGKVLTPRLLQIAAPSQKQLSFRARKECWEQSWYLLYQPAER